MFSLMQISEGPNALVLSYPLWIGAVFVVLAAVAIGWAMLPRRRARRRWPFFTAAAIASWAAIYVATFSATITADAGRVYGFLRYDYSVRWQDARDIYLEHSSGRWTIVVRDRNDSTFDFDVADLSVEQRDRVMAYMVDRMPESAFHRDTTVLKREGPGPRSVSFSSDEQI
jgi:hypothetical protein